MLAYETDGPHGEETSESLDEDSSPRLTDSEMMGTSVLQSQGPDFCNNPNEHGDPCFPRAPREKFTLTNT